MQPISGRAKQIKEGKPKMPKDPNLRQKERIMMMTAMGEAASCSQSFRILGPGFRKGDHQLVKPSD